MAPRFVVAALFRIRAEVAAGAAAFLVRDLEGAAARLAGAALRPGRATLGAARLAGAGEEGRPWALASSRRAAPPAIRGAGSASSRGQ